jgi:hypothetical protein
MARGLLCFERVGSVLHFPQADRHGRGVTWLARHRHGSQGPNVMNLYGGDSRAPDIGGGAAL